MPFLLFIEINLIDYLLRVDKYIIFYKFPNNLDI